ncbi:MAG: biotin-dependent carboxyltransferase family protein [Betaproteobacteria bacterium]
MVRAGVLTSVQDLGRYGLQHLGIVPGGAMDSVAHRIANALVGNPADAATLECTVLGPKLIVEHDMLIALYGAAFDAKAGNLPWPRNRPALVKAGTSLSIGAATHGARAYLAIAGGIHVPEVLGSRSTYVPAGFGGLSGRAVKAGDRLPCSSNLAALSASRFERITRGRPGTERAVWRSVHWFVPDLTLPSSGALVVRAMEGRHHAQFDSDSRAAFFGHEWKVTPDSNRMGFRLHGPRLTRAKPADILTEPTCLGTVQVPNDGAPIALMADHQTTGGYPKIAEIAGADIPGLAQLAPGGSVRFVKCSLEEAEAARIAADAQVGAVLRGLESIFT